MYVPCKKHTLISLFFIFWGLSKLLAKDNIPRVGTPYVQQYDKSIYKAGNQNWGISVSSDGLVYTANTEGLLCFNGEQWKLYHAKNNKSLRSVLAASDNRIYTGGLGEFGFWTRGPLGKMDYTSLSPLVPDQKSLQNDEIWRILIDGDKVFFHSFSKSYLFENNEIKTVTASGEPFLFSHLVQNKLYFEQIPSGLHQYQHNQLIPVAGKDILNGKNILCMLPFKDNQVLIGTANDGLYVLNQSGVIKPWINEAQQLLQKHQINNGVALKNGAYAFGTIQNGVFIVNDDGELVQHINKNNGLQNNTVLSIAIDNQFNLWVGLDNGIDRIDINSSFYYYSDLTGALGTVYTSIIHRNKIYLGTNQGLFVSNWYGIHQYSPLNFNLISGSNGQVWELIEINGDLYCGHNNGTYLVNDNGITHISEKTGGWKTSHVPNSRFALQGNYTGISLFDTGTRPMSFILQFDQIKEPVKHIFQQNQQDVWIGNDQEVKRIQFKPTLSAITHIEHSISGFPKGNFYGIYALANQTVFASDSGFYKYDNVLNRFERYDQLNNQLGSFATANKIISIQKNQYWFLKHSHIAKVELEKEGNIKIDSTSWNVLKGRMMNRYENIIQIDSDTHLIGLDNGFALYTDGLMNKIHIPKPIIAEIWNITSELRPLFDELNIPYKQNNIRIAYSLPWYSSDAINYQYLLEGYNDNWSEWDATSYRDFTNLTYGKYTFRIRGVLSDGRISEESSIVFTILRPWYWSWLAISIYSIILIMLYIFIKKWYRRRLDKHQKSVRDKVIEEQKLAIAREAELSERKLMELKNEKLEQELAIKNRELANTAMNIVYKNEMLNNLHDELTKLKDANGNKLSLEQLRKVNKIIEEAHNDTRDWNIFEESFNEAHENFFKKLKADYPALVPNDLKLCAYLRLNMSSKEIASLLNISVRGVEIRRYRLRKKLDLPTDKNLTEFLIEL